MAGNSTAISNKPAVHPPPSKNKPSSPPPKRPTASHGTSTASKKPTPSHSTSTASHSTSTPSHSTSTASHSTSTASHSTSTASHSTSIASKGTSTASVGTSTTTKKSTLSSVTSALSNKLTPSTFSNLGNNGTSIQSGQNTNSTASKGTSTVTNKSTLSSVTSALSNKSTPSTFANLGNNGTSAQNSSISAQSNTTKSTSSNTQGSNWPFGTADAQVAPITLPTTGPILTSATGGTTGNTGSAGIGASLVNNIGNTFNEFSKDTTYWTLRAQGASPQTASSIANAGWPGSAPSTPSLQSRFGNIALPNSTISAKTSSLSTTTPSKATAPSVSTSVKTPLVSTQPIATSPSLTTTGGASLNALTAPNTSIPGAVNAANASPQVGMAGSAAANIQWGTNPFTGEIMPTWHVDINNPKAGIVAGANGNFPNGPPPYNDPNINVGNNGINGIFTANLPTTVVDGISLTGPITFRGKFIHGLSSLPIYVPQGQEAKNLLEFQHETITATPPNGQNPWDPKYFTPVVSKIMSQPGIPDAMGRSTGKFIPQKFMAIATGMGNTPPSPAFMAQMLSGMGPDSYLAILGSNPQPGTMHLRPFTNFQGTFLPDELQGRVFIIGGEDPISIDYQQQHDLNLRQLNLVDQQIGKMTNGKIPYMKDGILLGHSNGAPAAMLEAQDLQDIGEGNAIGMVVTVGGSQGGTYLFQASPRVRNPWLKSLEKLGPQAMRAVLMLNPDNMAKDKALQRAINNKVAHISVGFNVNNPEHYPFDYWNPSVSKVSLKWEKELGGILHWAPNFFKDYDLSDPSSWSTTTLDNLAAVAGPNDGMSSLSGATLGSEIQHVLPFGHVSGYNRQKTAADILAIIAGMSNGKSQRTPVDAAGDLIHNIGQEINQNLETGTNMLTNNLKAAEKMTEDYLNTAKTGMEAGVQGYEAMTRNNIEMTKNAVEVAKAIARMFFPWWQPPGD